jgi:hypothetical protein
MSYEILMSETVISWLLILSLKFSRKKKEAIKGLKERSQELNKKIIKSSRIYNRISEAPYLSHDYDRSFFSLDPGYFPISFLRKERSHLSFGNSQTNLQNENWQKFIVPLTLSELEVCLG